MIICSCSTKRKSLEYDACSRSELAHQGEQHTQTSIMDSIVRLMSFNADSIIISFPLFSPGEEMLPYATAVTPARRAEVTSVQGSAPPFPGQNKAEARSGASTRNYDHSRIQNSHVMDIQSIANQNTANLSPIPPGGIPSGNIPQGRIGIYRPHLSASSEERSVGESSASDVSHTSLTSEDETKVKQETAPAITKIFIIKIQMMTIVAHAGIAILFSAFNKRRKPKPLGEG